jgi:hypothetical protein
MRKTLLIITVLVTGCAGGPEYVGIDYPVQSPTYASCQPPLINYNTSHLQQYLNDSMRASEELKQFTFQSTNRQEVINRVEQFQIANRRLNELLQNPWNGFYLLRQ